MKRSKLFVLFLAVTMASYMSLTAFAAGPDAETEIEKEETVYVYTDANGNQKDVTVYSLLRNSDGEEQLSDKTILKNVEGEAAFTQDGENLTWEADGNDITYQGTTDKGVPVTQKITYTLDGKEITPEELAGKSGKVTIHIDYKNTEKYGNVFVPFTAMTKIVFPKDSVKNIVIDNGCVLPEDENTVIVGMAFPGLSESLQDKGIPGSVEITMDAEEFTMSNCMTVIFSGLLDSDKNIDSVLNEMSGKLSGLTNASNTLKNNASNLYDRIRGKADGLNVLTSGANDLNAKITDYMGNVSDVNNSAKQVADSADTVAEGLPALTDTVKTFTEGIAKADTDAGQLKSDISEYTKGAADVHAEAGNIKNESDGISANPV